MKSFRLRHQSVSLIQVLLIVVLIYTAPAAAQSVGTISGYIEDAESGAPLPGANIRVDDHPGGTVSDENGEYRLRRVPMGEQTLVVSFIEIGRAHV